MTDKCDMLGIISFMGNKWSYPVLKFIRKKRKVTFSEVIKSNENMNPRSLSKTLKSLREFKAVKLYQNRYYMLTDQGKRLERWLRSISSYILFNDLCIPKECKYHCMECEYFNSTKKSTKK